MDHIYAKKKVDQKALEAGLKKACALRLALLSHVRRAGSETRIHPRLRRRLDDWERMCADINSKRNKAPEGSFHRPGSNK